MDPLYQEVGSWWVSLASLPPCCCCCCNPHYKDIKNSPPPPPPSSSSSSSSLPTMTITEEPQFHVLAVDDSLLDRKLIERLLRTSSYQVTTVDSGSKALEFLGLQESSVKNEMEVSLIITDYCMPGMTGYDLLKRIKESAALRDIPVVIMSSENVPSRINRCLEEGAEEFFLKPVQLADMNRLRPHILRGKSKDQLWPNGTTTNSSNHSSKRKAMDDECPHERKRSRFPSNLTLV